MPNYFIYARKSTESEERQQLSIPAQLDELRDFAKKNNLQITDTLFESKTAKEPGRKVFNTMIDRIKAREADGILTWHPDRLARNAVDAGQIIHLLDTGKLIDLKFPTIDFQNNPNGKFMLQINFATSKNYVDNLSVNTKRGLIAKARRGMMPGVAPFGYRNSLINGRKIITVNKKLAPVAIELFKKYSSGNFTLKELSAWLFTLGCHTMPCKNGLGMKPLRIEHIKAILANPFYYGQFRYCGEVYQGKQKPLITKKLYDQVQVILNKKCWSNLHNQESDKRPYRWFAFSSLIKCGECGYHITTSTKVKHYKNGTSQTFSYFHCSHKSKTVHCRPPFTPQKMAINDLLSICRDVSLPEADGSWLLDQLEQDRQKELSNISQLKAKLNFQLDDLNAKLNKILNLFLDSTINREEYLGQKNELMAQRKTIEEQLLNLIDYQNDKIEQAKNFVRLTIQAGKISKQYLKIAENEGQGKDRIEPAQPADFSLDQSQITALTPVLADWLKKAELNLFLKDRKVYHIKQKQWAALARRPTVRNLEREKGG